jgi:Zn-dependent protease with chaperone function
MVPGIYFDGETATDRKVHVTADAAGISFEGSDVPREFWPYPQLRAIEQFHPGYPLRLVHKAYPGKRLVISDDAFARQLIASAPHLRSHYSLQGLGQAAMWVAGSIAAIAVVGWLVLQYAPQHLAFVLPDSWRERIGHQVEQSLTEGAIECRGPEGRSALAAMASRLAEGQADLPPLRISVYDIPVMNAFAMPGERIVITSELIRRAARPEQVAGVLAHEVGHVLRRHSEAQLVRATGLQVFLSLVTGGGSDTLTSIASVAAILTYTREAEAEADDVGLKLLEDAAIDPMGLKEFFDIILAGEGTPTTGAWRRVESAISTHPGTEDRIKKIHPLPEGKVARPVMTDAQWQGLKRICG